MYSNEYASISAVTITENTTIINKAYTKDDALNVAKLFNTRGLSGCYFYVLRQDVKLSGLT